LTEGAVGTRFPAVNVWSDTDRAVVTAELPGVNPEELEITTDADVLTISGSREAEDAGREGRYRRHERGHGSFTRRVPLPFPAEREAVEAGYTNGVLRITLPRSEASKPRRIEITG
jgi:HSP20 family protein